MKIAPALKPIAKAEKLRDFREFINHIADKYQDKTAFIIKIKKSRKDITYKHISYTQFRDDVNALALSFLKHGYDQKRIAIIGDNKYQWMLTYLAQVSIGGIVVPLDKGLAYPEFESSVQRSYADIIVYDKNHTKLIDELKASGNPIDTFFCMDGEEGTANAMADLLAEGRALDPSVLSEITIDPYKMSIILFTSGTTSMAKAVMLSQDNILSNMYDLEMTEDIHSDDVNMAFLPYHHTFGSTGQLILLQFGTTTTYCDGLKYVQKNLVEYKVSVFVCVPLLIESIYKKVITTARKNNLEGKLNFAKKVSRFLLKFNIDVRRKLFKTVLDQLGGELRLVISGAASIEPETLEGFRTFGIETINGYGMTESAPVLAAENRDAQRSGSIGHSMPSVTVAIDNPDEEGIGELIAKGPNVMLGYYENEEATNETIIDGWLHTGDLGYIDQDGYIFIAGRKKNVIVLKNGKNVFPEEIELMISERPYSSEVFVFGLPKKTDENDLTLYVKVVYNKEYFKELGIKDVDEIQKHIAADVEIINDSLPVYKKIHHVLVSDQEMIKTTTAKVKRHEEIKKIKAELGL